MFPSPRKHSNQRGQSLVLFTFVALLLIGMIALVIDVGSYLTERRRIQNAADAAALAGARMLPGQPGAAEGDALVWAESNGIADGELDSIIVSTSAYHNDTIQVTVTRDVDFIFTEAFGISSGHLKATATARVGSAAGAKGLAPFAVKQDVFAGLQPGDTANLKYNATSNETGNFLPLALDSTGANEYGDNIRFGSEAFLCAVGAEYDGCSTTASTQPGNVIGQTRQALQWIVSHTSAECDSYAEVFDEDALAEGFVTMEPECNRFINPTARSYRVFVVPVIANLCNGSCDVTVLEFALFFMESYTCSGGGQGNSCDLIGRYAQANVDIEGLIGPYDPDGSVSFIRLVE